MANSQKTQILIVRLKERGVISEAQAEAMIRYARKLDTPLGRTAGKALRFVVVKAISELLLRSFNDR